MVSTEYFMPNDPARIDDNLVGQIVLRPNNSMTWQAARFFLATLMLLSFTMAIAFTWQGYWMILPFTALEMSILVGCFYYLGRRNQTQEVVSMGPQQVVLEIGRAEPEVRREWQRFFTKVLVEAPKHPWYPSKVALRCRDEEHEIGAFLTAADKKELITALQRMIAEADRRQHLVTST